MSDERPVTGESASALSAGHVASAVVTFVVFGVGATLAVFLAVSLSESALVDVASGGGSLAVVVALLSAPLLAVFTGVRTGEAVPSARTATLSAGVGAVVGAAAMVVAVGALTAILGALGGGGGGMAATGGSFLASTTGYVVGVGLTGTAAGYVGWRFSRPR